MNNSMNDTKFVFDSSTLIHEIDENNVFLKTISCKYNLTGEGIVIAVRRIIDCFKDANLPKDVIVELSDIYEKTALSNLIELLISKDVLIPESEYNEICSLDESFLEKYRRLGIKGKSFQQTVSELQSMTIGVIGTNQFTKCFIANMSDDQMISHVNCIITDIEESNHMDKIPEGVEVSCFSDDSKLQLEKLIKECDFILVNSNYESVPLFSYVNKLCLEYCKKWLRVVISDESVELGPMFIPNETCCYSCMKKREEDSAYYKVSADYFALQKKQTSFYDKRLRTYSSYYLTLIATSISYYEMICYFTGISRRLKGNVLTFYPEDYKLRLNKVFKYTKCNSCNRME